MASGGPEGGTGCPHPQTRALHCCFPGGGPPSPLATGQTLFPFQMSASSRKTSLIPGLGLVTPQPTSAL